MTSGDQGVIRQPERHTRSRPLRGPKQLATLTHWEESGRGGVGEAESGVWKPQGGPDLIFSYQDTWKQVSHQLVIMRHNLSKEEETVLTAWKALLRDKGINTSNHALHSLLLWAKSQNFNTDSDTAFSIKAWKKVRNRLWEVIRAGDKMVVDLAVTWGLLFEALKEWRSEREHIEQDTDEKSELTVETDGVG